MKTTNYNLIKRRLLIEKTNRVLLTDFSHIGITKTGKNKNISKGWIVEQINNQFVNKNINRMCFLADFSCDTISHSVSNILIKNNCVYGNVKFLDDEKTKHIKDGQSDFKLLLTCYLIDYDVDTDCFDCKINNNVIITWDLKILNHNKI